MADSVVRVPEELTPDGRAVSELYAGVLEAWNRRSARDFATLFTEDGCVIGFDGSQMSGRAAIEAELSRIFADHPTAAYVGIVRAVRFVGADAALLWASGGMHKHEERKLMPAANAIQSLVAVRRDGDWEIVHYQNTPAQFHDRPALSEQLSAELSALL